MSSDASMPRLRALTSERGAPATRLALRYLGFGLAALACAAFARGMGWLLCWLAASNGLLACAYATNRVRLLGKRDDGGIALPSLLAFLPYLLLVWSFFGLKRVALRRNEPCAVRVLPRLYMGRRPSRHELPPGCDLVVDLTCEFVEAHAVVAAAGYRCFPILNRHVPEAAEFERLVRDLAAFDGTIYVHCGAGRGRAAMLTAALLLMAGEADDVDAAEVRLQALRPGVSLHAVQRALVTRTCAALLRDEARHSPEASANTKCA